MWKEICKVIYTDSKILHNPYSTDAAVQTLTKDQAYTHQAVTLTDEYVTIDTIKHLAQYIDRADLAQISYVSQMELADSQGQLLNEAIETAMMAAHAEWTDFDNSQIGGSAGNIAVDENNVDLIINGIIREIQEAKGTNVYNRNGGFIVWRPADFEKLKTFMMANGFSTADEALKGGAKSGIPYMGLTHYVSNFHASGHLFAGVKKLFTLGICRSTYGQVIVTDEPATAEGAVSAVAVASRVDYKFKAFAKVKPVLFDVLVS